VIGPGWANFEQAGVLAMTNNPGCSTAWSWHDYNRAHDAAGPEYSASRIGCQILETDRLVLTLAALSRRSPLFVDELGYTAERSGDHQYYD